jgi:hypothetical protein
MKHTVDMTGGKPIAILITVHLRCECHNPLVTFYDIHGRKGEVLFLNAIDLSKLKKKGF